MQVEAALTRREREKMARRREMLHAARVVFAEKGYHGATVDEIAQRAQFGKGTVYNYFDGGKEELLRAVLDEMYEEVGAIAAACFTPGALNGTPLRDLFRAYLVQVFSYYRDNLDVFVILLKEAYRMLMADEAHVAAYFAERRADLLESLRPALQHGIDSGQLRPLPVDAVGQLLLGNIKGCQLHACLEARRHAGGECVAGVSPEEQADFLTTLLFDGLLMREPAHATNNIA